MSARIITVQAVQVDGADHRVERSCKVPNQVTEFSADSVISVCEQFHHDQRFAGVYPKRKQRL